MKSLGMILLIWVASIFWSACERSGRSAADTDLRGTWSAEFRARSGDGVASGLVVLDSARVNDTLCDGGAADCRRSVAHGSHEIDFGTLVGHDLSSEVVAGADEADQIVFGFGACCDQGEISARGEMKGGTITGRWSETFIAGGRQGTFTIRPSE